MSEELLVGVDLGGTKIEAVLARREPGGDLSVLDRRRVPTASEEGYEAVLARAEALIRAIAAGNDLEAIPVGVGMPGGTTRRSGLVKNSNAVCLNGRPFRADLLRKSRLPGALCQRPCGGERVSAAER